MADLPDRARAVIIGAGIMGSALVHHLSLQGWTDLVLVDQGPFPNAGGSTGHSSAMVWLPEATRLLTNVTADSVRQYIELGVHKACGGLDVGRTPERIADYRRRLGFIRTWGYDAELVTPSEIKALVPYLDDSVLLGGLYSPRTGVVDAIRAGTLMREQAIASGSLATFPLTEVTGLDVEDDRIAGVRTARGRIRTDLVIICCGVWSPRIARMAGATIPFTPGVSQLVSIGPIAAFADLPGEISFPVIRDSDPKVYARRVGGDMEIGSAGHRPILVDPNDIPSLAEARLTPTELPFTADDFDASLESALELFPALFEDERAGIRYAINGLVSLSADGLPILGELTEVGGLWSANRIDIKVAPAAARILAGWLTTGMPQTALHPFDIARFLDHERTAVHVRSRATEWWTRNYEMVHPSREFASNRNQRLSPMHSRLAELGGVFAEQGGWEVAKWYVANEPLLAEYGERTLGRPNEWDARWWSPIVNAEHLALRERVGLEDTTAQAVFEVTGPGAAAWLEGLAVSPVDHGSAGAASTWLLDPAGGIVSEVSIVRLGEDRFRVVSPASGEARDRTWLVDHLPADGSVALHDATSAWCSVGVWGPRSRDLLGAAGLIDLADAAFPLGMARTADIGGLPALLARSGRLGELGWEVHAQVEHGLRLWDILWEAGRSLGVLAVGSGVSATTARLEKSYRARATDLAGGYDLVEAGLGGPAKAAGFIGRAAYLEQLARPPAALLCTLLVEDHRSATGELRYMLGGEPVVTRAGGPLIDAKGRRSFVTSAGSAPSLGRHLLMAYLPPDQATPGTELAVECFGDRYPVTVASVGSKPMFDPENRRIRA